jgi:hypothetical protein
MARTMKALRVLGLDQGDAPPDDDAPPRPVTRGDCVEGLRPCPFVSCRQHLYLDVHPRTGAIKRNRPDVAEDELDRMPETCALDVADRGGASLVKVGRLMNVTRERVRQIEKAAQAKLEAHPEVRALFDALEQQSHDGGWPWAAGEGGV